MDRFPSHSAASGSLALLPQLTGRELSCRQRAPHDTQALRLAQGLHLPHEAAIILGKSRHPLQDLRADHAARRRLP